MPLFRRSPPASPDAARSPTLDGARREILNNTSMPPGEFARTHGAVVERLWDAYGLFPPDDAARIRQSFVDALSTVLKHRRAFVLPRFTPADDQWRMRECISFALTAAVSIDHLAAYLKSRDALYGTTLAALWDGLGPGRALAASPGLPAALYHLLVPPRGRQWIDSEPPVAALLANYYAGAEPDDLRDVIGPVLPRYLPGGRHAAPEPAAAGQPRAAPADGEAGAPRLKDAGAAVRDAARDLLHPGRNSPDAARLRSLRLGAAEAAAGPARALRLTGPQHAALVLRLEVLAVAFARDTEERPLQHLDADAAVRHLATRAARHREALEQAAADFAARRDAEHREFVDAHTARRRQADADLAADARALRLAIRHRDPDTPADRAALVPFDDLPPLPEPDEPDAADGRYAADTAAAVLAPRLRPGDRPAATDVVARLAAAADLDALSPADAEAHLRARAAELDQDALDAELRIAEAVLHHWSRTLDPAHRLGRPASLAMPARTDAGADDAIAIEVRADRDAERAAEALHPLLAPSDDDALDRARAVLRRFARFAARHGRTLADATPALATGHLETLDAPPADAETVLRDLLVHYARTLAPGGRLPPPHRPRPGADRAESEQGPPAVAEHRPADSAPPATGPAAAAAEPAPPAPRPDRPGSTDVAAATANDVSRADPGPGDRPPDVPPAAPADRARITDRRDPQDAPPPVEQTSRAPQPHRRSGRRRSRTRTRPATPWGGEDADPDPRPAPRHTRDQRSDLLGALPAATTAAAPDSHGPRKRLPVVDADPNAHPADGASLDPGPGARLAPWRTPPFDGHVDAPRGERLPYSRLFPRRSAARRPDPAIYEFVDHLVAAVRDGRIVPNAADSLLHKVPEGWFLVTPAAYHHHLHAKHPDDHPRRLDQNTYVRELALAGYLALNARAAAQPDADPCARHTFTARGAGDAVRAGLILADAVIRDEVPNAPLDASPWIYVPRLLDHNERRPVAPSGPTGARAAA